MELAEIADRIAMARFRSADLVVERKPDGSPVTDADYAIEAALKAHLEAAVPQDSFLGEESGRHGKSRRVWMIDPIDQTSGFVGGQAGWATLIGLCEDLVPVVGVVSRPAIGRRWWGAVGVGAWADGSPIAVSETRALADAAIADDHRACIERGLRWNPLVAIAERCARAEARSDISTTLRVAEGSLDLNFSWHAGSGPDLASIMAILRAAGGRFADLDGSVNIHSDVWLASNGRVHDEAVAIAREVIAAGDADPRVAPD